MRVRLFIIAALVLAALPISMATASSPAAVEVDPFLVGELARGVPAVTIVNAETAAAAEAAIEGQGLPVLMRFPKLDAAVTKATSAQVEAMKDAAGVVYLQGNQPVRSMLTTAIEATRVPLAVQEYAAPTTTSTTSTKGKGRGKQKTTTVTTPGRGLLDGNGVGVAIVDSGLAADHPMFAGRIARNLKQICLPIVCADSEGDAADEFFVDAGTSDTDSGLGGGHGTHVTGIAAGGVVRRADGSDIRGVASGSSIYGIGSGLGLFVLDPVASLNWILEHHRDPCEGEPGATPECPPIQVVNNSYGSVSEYNANGIYEKASDRLVQEGVVMVWAAGNGDELNDGGDGSDNRTNGPAASPVPGVIMVANYDDGDSGTRTGSLDSSSSRGERGRPQTYPDLSAPGSSITSACRITLPICSPDPLEPDFGTISGTSMASPHVAGAVALLRQAHPAATPADLEFALENSAYKFGDLSSYEADPRNPNDTTSFDKGHGLLDVANALRLLDARAIDGRIPPACAPGGVVLTDPEGDATQVAFVDGGADVYSAARDVTSIAVDSAGDGATTFTIAVASLGDPATDGPGGISIDATFTAGGADRTLSASRDPAGITAFSVDGTSVTGAFRPGTPGIVTLTAPRGAFEPDLFGPVTFGGFAFFTRYDTGAVLAPVSDDGSGNGCVTYDVGGSAAPPPSPSYTPPAPEATIAKGQSLAISGGPKTDAQMLGDTPLGPCAVTASGCDVRGFQLEPGAGSLLEVTVAGDAGAADLDLYVLDPEGNEVARSATAEATESISQPITKAGIYTVRVVWYLSVAGSYTGSIALA